MNHGMCCLTCNQTVSWNLILFILFHFILSGLE